MRTSNDLILFSANLQHFIPIQILYIILHYHNGVYGLMLIQNKTQLAKLNIYKENSYNFQNFSIGGSGIYFGVFGVWVNKSMDSDVCVLSRVFRVGRLDCSDRQFDPSLVKIRNFNCSKNYLPF